MPQREYKGGLCYLPPFEPDAVLFFLQEGRFLPINAALCGGFNPGLIGGDEPTLIQANTNITIRFEVKIKNKKLRCFPGGEPMLISFDQWPGYPPRSYQVSQPMR